MRSWRDPLAFRPRRGLPPPTAGHSLALVIPVHDDAAGLARLLAQARGMAVFAQIVVVDDGSEVPVAVPPDVTLIRHRRARGGGTARNRGLRAVTCDYVLFFDADDLLTPDLPRLVTDLRRDIAAHGAFDMCLFKHADSRVAAEGLWGQPDWDERWWQAAGIGPAALVAVGHAGRLHLVQTANYPWNKILRVAFLRHFRIGCAPTMVHQDIPLHWLAFLHAGRMLASDRICAIHHVAPRGGRITNLRGRERLQVFAALDPVARAVRGDPGWQAALAGFVPGLLDWIGGLIDPGLRPEFAAAARTWCARHGLPLPPGPHPEGPR